MTDRAKIVARIRALLQMTVANGCTEEEAATAARLAAKLIAEHAVEETETSVEEDLYEGERVTILDQDIGERIWKPASPIADLTACRYWTSQHGVVPHYLAFFGEAHAVKIAKYLLAICFRAMEAGKTTVQERFALQPRKVRPNVISYLDGMADRLYERIKEMVPKPETGTGLVVLKFALIDERMKKGGHHLGEQKGRASRNFDSYQDGRAHADRVNLNAGITAATPERIR